MEDKELLTGIREGSAEALELAIRRYGGYVKSVITRRLGRQAGAEDVEELVSDTFLTLWRAGKDIRGEHLAGWLAVVARREALGYLRRRRPPGACEEEYLAFADAEAEKAYSREELKLLLAEVLKTLGQEDRRIFLLFYYNGSSIEEIAGKIGMNPETVKSRLARGRAKLKTALLERGYELED